MKKAPHGRSALMTLDGSWQVRKDRRPDDTEPRPHPYRHRLHSSSRIEPRISRMARMTQPGLWPEVMEGLTTKYAEKTKKS
jgi:hypothetical protein